MSETGKDLGRPIPQTLKETMEWTPTAVQRERAIRANYLQGEEAYLIVGFLLRQSKNAGDWKKDGIANSFFEWVEKELLISGSNAQRMLLIWDVVSPLLKSHQELILQIDFSKLAEVATILKGMNEQKALEWLHVASTNTMKDLKNNIKAHKGDPNNPPTDVCDHKSTEQWVKCKICKAFIKV
ncbi:MAG: hypothetical protein EHM36_00695 [Deltaproteobacteria bacterium]|nr:MAG: hypothetical protein EHM36_00695 [Deltaproteobacteria bacterium]